MRQVILQCGDLNLSNISMFNCNAFVPGGKHVFMMAS